MEGDVEHIKMARLRVNEHRKPVCVNTPEFVIEIKRIIKVEVNAELQSILIDFDD